MNKRSNYKIDEVTINQLALKQFLNKSSGISRIKNLQQIFYMLELCKSYEKDPMNQLTKSKIKQIYRNLQNNQKNPLMENQESQTFIIDLDQKHPLNKSGLLGRQLQRTAKILNRSVLESQGNRQYKAKQIVSFINRVESYSDPKKDQLVWLNKFKQYPFRIILLDKNNNHKGVYFKSFQKAERIRIYYLNLFHVKVDIPILIHRLSNVKFKGYCSQIVYYKLINYFRANKKKGSRFSKVRQQQNKQSVDQILKKSLLRDDVQKNSKYSESFYKPTYLDPKENSYLNSLFTKKEKIQSIQPLQTKFNPDVIFKLNDKYKQQLMVKWLELSKIQSQLNLNRQRPSINSPDKNKTQKIEDGVMKLLFIQFLKMQDLLFKPIVTIQLLKKGVIQCTGVFNTYLVKKAHSIRYKLILSEGNQMFKLYAKNISGQKQQYQIHVKVMDYLTNTFIYEEQFVLKQKLLVTYMHLISKNKNIKLEILYSLEDNKLLTSTIEKVIALKKEKQSAASQSIILQIQPLNQSIIKKIKGFWEDQSAKRGYYSIDAQMKIVQILGYTNTDQYSSWWLDIDQQTYRILCCLKNASQLLNFKLIKSFLPIIKAFEYIYSDLEELLLNLLSIIVNYSYRYYSPEYFNKVCRFHQLIGLDTDCSLASKIGVQINVMKKIILLQIPSIYDKFQRRNLIYGYIIYEYIYELYSKNFSTSILIQVWNYIFKNVQFLQMYMILLGVWLIKYYQIPSLSCRRNRQFKQLLQSKEPKNSSMIIRGIEQLRKKYFPQKSSGIIDEIKSMFLIKPFEQITSNLYKKQLQLLDQRKINRQIQKKNILNKRLSQIKNFSLRFPQYSIKKLVFHIHFYNVSEIKGNLFLVCDDIQYQCVSFEKTHYFIISQTPTPILVKYVDYNSNIYTSYLELIQGINTFKVYLKCKKQMNLIQLEYMSGLLTQQQVQNMKKNKNFQHILGSFMKISILKQQLLRPISQIPVSNYENVQQSRRILKKLFSSGNHLFNAVEYYLRKFEAMKITLVQKFQLISEYATKISKSYFLCDNKILQKIFLREFISYLSFPLQQFQFESFYNDSLKSQFDAPKIVKCRYVEKGKQLKQVKLQKYAINYIAKRSSNYVYGDIIVDEFFATIQDKIIQTLGSIKEGNLVFVFSSDRKMHYKVYDIIKNKNILSIIEKDKELKSSNQTIFYEQPQILMTQILPTFSKISTILDFMHNSKTIQTKPKEKKFVAESVNILKNAQSKLNNVIRLRYYRYPNKIQIPFLQYYHELLHEIDNPDLPTIFYNNARSDIKTVCICSSGLNFSENKKGETLFFKKQLGINGNLRKILAGVQSVFFWSYQKDQNIDSDNINMSPYKILVNYGYGIFRWEQCIVKGYRYRVKQRQTKVKQDSSQPKKEYLVELRNQQFYARGYSLKMSDEDMKKIPNLNNKDNKRIEIQKKQDNSSSFLSKFLL